jgi:hypothetical protein
MTDPDLKVYFDVKTGAQWIITAQNEIARAWLQEQRNVVALPKGFTASVLHKEIGSVLREASAAGLRSIVF